MWSVAIAHGCRQLLTAPVSSCEGNRVHAKQEIIKGSLDEKLPSYEVLKMLRE